jgi:predicted NUDIX family phosphoesterase
MEQILVVPRSALLEVLSPKGMLNAPLERALGLIAAHGDYRGRGTVEEDPSLKQPIPYLVLQADGLTFTYRRQKGGGEKRLHDCVSIGVGGHMRRMAEDPAENLEANLERELHEELHVETPYAKHFLGFLNEDFTPVCQVHLGLVYRIVPEDPAKVRVAEERELKGEWLPASAVDQRVPDMEIWSQIVWDHLRGGAR